jgi:type IV pilus assembly protein PilC
LNAVPGDRLQQFGPGPVASIETAMADYLIKVADERGHVTEQTEKGFSEDEIRNRYVQQGYLVYSIKPRTLLGRRGWRLSSRRKVKLSQFVIFNQQFLTLFRAGLPIVQGLDLLAKREKNKFFRSVLQDVRDRVKGGEPLSEAFDAQGVFPKIYSTTLLAGEKSGNLDEVLARYLGFLRMTLTFRKKLVTSLIYPAVLVVGVTVLITFLVTFVVPRFGALYSDLGENLPAITMFTLTMANNIKTYLPIIVLALAAGGILLHRWSLTDRGGQQIDKVKLNLPIFGGIWIKYQVAMLSRMLSTLLSGGLPLVSGLDTASQSMQSRLMKNAITHATQNVREGRTLSHSLEETKLFPALSVEMIEVGESTGALSAMLNSVADFFEEDVQNALTAAMALIEPAIMIFMGIIVAFILISLYLPIFSMGVGVSH